MWVRQVSLSLRGYGARILYADSATFGTGSHFIIILSHVQETRNSAFVGDTGYFDAEFDLPSLLVPNASIAQEVFVF